VGRGLDRANCLCAAASDRLLPVIRERTLGGRFGPQLMFIFKFFLLLREFAPSAGEVLEKDFRRNAFAARRCAHAIGGGLMVVLGTRRFHHCADDPIGWLQG
jgi:hypothetical protein